MLLRDKFWLWGHPEGRYNNNDFYGHHAVSRMTPMEACLYLGIKKTFMVPEKWEVNRRQYNKSFTTLNEVAWECHKACKTMEELEVLIQDCADFPNVIGVVYDDFQSKDKYKEIPVESLWERRELLKNNNVRPLDSWMVLYTREFGLDAAKDEDFMRYIEPFDGIIMWTWEEKDVPLIPEKWEQFKKMTPNKRRMFGCYLYNFGEAKQATGAAVKWQLDWYREKLLAGEAEGIVLHTNTMADLDYEAYDAALEWMAEHGDEVIPD